VHARQAQVEDEQVEFMGGHQGGIGFAAIGHVVHDRARRAQRAQERIGENLIVFGNEDAHAAVSWYRRPRSAP